MADVAAARRAYAPGTTVQTHLSTANSHLRPDYHLEGVELVAREMAHLLNNDLSAPLGVIELLQEQVDLPPHLRVMLQHAANGLDAAVEHIRQLQQVRHVAIKNSPVGPALDLERSLLAHP